MNTFSLSLPIQYLNILVRIWLSAWISPAAVGDSGKKDPVVGSIPNAQLDIRKPLVHYYIRDLVSTVDRYFESDLYHLGGDEVALIWQTEVDRKLLAMFFEWLKTVRCCQNQTLISDVG